MTSKLLGCVLLLAACGKFQDHPDRFTLQMISPQPFGSVDIHSGNAALQSKNFFGPTLQCSLSDPFAALTVESQGCPLWTAFTSEGVSTSTWPVATLTPQRKVIRGALFPGSSAQFRVTARCGSLADNPIEIGFPYEAGSTGITISDLSSLDKDAEPIEQLLPLPYDQFLAVGHRWVAPIQRNDAGEWQLGTLRVSADGRARVYVAGKRVVVKDSCDGFACPYDLQNLYTWEVEGPGATLKVAINTVSASTEFLGLLATNRLAFYQATAANGTSGRIALFDATLGSEKDLPLATPAFPADTTTLPGVSSPTGLSYMGWSMNHFWRVQIDATSESVSQADLGSFSGDELLSARPLPDGSAFLYWGKKKFDGPDCILGLRDAQTGIDRWTQSLCPDPSVLPEFVSDDRQSLVVILTSDQLLALDSQTGATRWSWNRMISGLSIPVTSVRTSGDAIIVTTDGHVQPRVQVIGADGAPRLRVPIETQEIMSGFVATSDGVLVGSAGRFLYAVQAADARLDAPPHSCTNVDCGAGIVDLAADPQNCGQCGQACTGEATCLSGACVSQPSL